MLMNFPKGFSSSSSSSSSTGGEVGEGAVSLLQLLCTMQYCGGWSSRGEVQKQSRSSSLQCQHDLASVLTETEHRQVQIITTMSGPAIDVDQPASRIPATVRFRPPDAAKH